MHECWTHAQELATAVSMGINLTVLILNDDAYGMIKWKQVGPCDRLVCWSALKGVPKSLSTDMLCTFRAITMSKGQQSY